MNNKISSVEEFDPLVWGALKDEEQRQEDHIELIASENYTSPRVMQMQGTVLTNKYAEGYPRKRYYGGCQHVDVIESLAIERAKKIIRCFICKRSTSFGFAGQCCCIYGTDKSR